MKIVGSLDYGQTSDPVRYNRHPRFRAFKFAGDAGDQVDVWVRSADGDPIAWVLDEDRKSTRLNSSHGYISYAVFCLKKKQKLINDVDSGQTGGTSVRCLEPSLYH